MAELTTQEVTIQVVYSPERQADPISAVPEKAYLFTKKYPNTAVWRLSSSDADAKISRIVFEGSREHGPLSTIKPNADDHCHWVGPCLENAEKGEFKYSIFVMNGKGEEIELDPVMAIDLPDGGGGG